MDTKNITLHDAAQLLNVDAADVNFGILIVSDNVKDYLQASSAIVAPDAIDPVLLHDEDTLTIAQLEAAALYRGIDVESDGVLIPVWSAPNSGEHWGFALVSAGEVESHAARVAELLIMQLEEALKGRRALHMHIGSAVKDAVEATGNEALNKLTSDFFFAQLDMRFAAEAELKLALQKEGLGNLEAVNLERLFAVPEPTLFDILTLLKQSWSNFGENPKNDLMGALSWMSGHDKVSTTFQVVSGLKDSRWDFETVQDVVFVASRLDDAVEFLAKVVDAPHEVYRSWNDWIDYAQAYRVRPTATFAKVSLDELVYGSPELDELDGTVKPAMVVGTLYKSYKAEVPTNDPRMADAFKRLSPSWRNLLTLGTAAKWPSSI